MEHFGAAFYAQYQQLDQQVWPLFAEQRSFCCSKFVQKATGEDLIVQNVVKLMKQQYHKVIKTWPLRRRVFGEWALNCTLRFQRRALDLLHPEQLTAVRDKEVKPVWQHFLAVAAISKEMEVIR